MGQPLDVLSQPVGIEPLDGLDDPAMEGAPPVREQAAVGHLAGERVLEGVLEVRNEAGLVQELGPMQGRERTSQRVLGNVCDGPQEDQRHILPDDGGRLDELPGIGREPIHPSRQDRLDRRWDLDRLDWSGQVMRAPRATQGAGLHQRPHGLLQKEGIPLGLLDEERREPLEPRVRAEEAPEKLAHALGRQRVEALLRVGRLAAPAVLILGAIVDQKAEPGRRETLDEAVKERLRLGIDPVEILHHEQYGLDPRLVEPESLDRIQRPLPPPLRVQFPPGIVVHRHVEQCEERGEARLQGAIERQDSGRHLVANLPRVVAVLDVEIGLEQVDHGQIRRRLAVRDRAAVPDEPATIAMRLHDLPN